MMETKLISVQRSHGRATLVLSTGETLAMPRAMLKERPYRSGTPFDREAFDSFLLERSYPFAMEKAVALLAMRSRTQQEIADALRKNEGWLFDVGEPHDEKVMNREIGRLKMSLDAAEPGLEKLVFLHYPPVYTGTSAPEIVATLKAYGIRTCYYGHLHGNAIRYAVQGDVDGIRYKLVSADGLRFCPYRIN